MLYATGRIITEVLGGLATVCPIVDADFATNYLAFDSGCMMRSSNFFTSFLLLRVSIPLTEVLFG